MKKSREEWERSVRERQENMTPDQRIRSLSRLAEFAPPGTAYIRGPRQLRRVLAGLFLLVAGCGLIVLALACRYGTTFEHPKWLGSIPAFVAILAVAAILLALARRLVLSNMRI